MRMKIEQLIELVDELKERGYLAYYAFDSGISVGIPYRTYVVVKGIRQT